jgi:hypothetical protein
LAEMREILNHRGEAMIHSSRRNPKAKAIAEVLAMIADAPHEIATHYPRPVRKTNEWLWGSATEFCAAVSDKEHMLAGGGNPFPRIAPVSHSRKINVGDGPSGMPEPMLCGRTHCLASEWKS